MDQLASRMAFHALGPGPGDRCHLKVCEHARLGHMNSLHPGQGAGGRCTGYARCGLARRIYRATRVPILLLAVTFSLSLYAQNVTQPGISAGVQTPSNLDCSDPLMAASAECAGQNQRQIYSAAGSTAFLCNRYGIWRADAESHHQLFRYRGPRPARNRGQSGAANSASAAAFDRVPEVCGFNDGPGIADLWREPLSLRAIHVCTAEYGSGAA